MTGNKNLIEINDGAKTPSEYFKILKTSLKGNSKKKLDSQLATVAENIMKAKEVGQRYFLHKLSFAYNVIKKEQELLALGYNKYVLREDVLHMIDKVVPKRSIKMIELERYPRAIPTNVLDILGKVKSLDIFDGFVVVFTDFTDEKYQTEADKKIISQNRDPVLLGYFRHKDSGLNHDRLYFLADWIDEYCELDFASMIEKMSDVGIKNPEKTISTDNKYLTNLVEDIVADALEDMKPKKSSFGEVKEVKGIKQKFIDLFF